jgi:nitrile hydratase accessory protein
MSNCGKTTLSPNDAAAPGAAQAAAVAALPGLPRDAAGPVFAEPWQAQAFALTVRLHEAGRFTWPEWAGALAAVLREAVDRGEPDDGTHYYEHWLVALERLATAKRLVDAAELAQRRHDWEAAYLATPHGQPVALAHG